MKQSGNRGRVLQRVTGFPRVGLFVLLTIISVTGCKENVKPVTTRTEFYLGTSCTVTLYDRTKKSLVDDVFNRIEEIEALMSFQRPDSEVSLINRNAGVRPVSVSGETLWVCERAVRFAALSEGAFDITIGPLVELWGIGTENAAVPETEQIEALLPLVDYRKIQIDSENGTIYLPAEGMKIDLGGIAKGYAADEAARILLDGGISRAIIDFGGNVYALGAKSGEQPWRVGIQHPRAGRGSYIGIAEAEDKAFVSSGDYERYFMQSGNRYHHILDTETGYPVRNDIIGVTIISGDALTADALSTAVFSLGVEKGMRLLSSIGNAETTTGDRNSGPPASGTGPEGIGGIIVTEEKQIYLAGSIEGEFDLVDNSFTVEEYSISPAAEEKAGKNTSE